MANQVLGDECMKLGRAQYITTAAIAGIWKSRYLAVTVDLDGGNEKN